MFGLGVGELVLILVLVVFIFGSKKIPELAKGLGQGINEFKKSLNELDETPEKDKKDKPSV